MAIRQTVTDRIRGTDAIKNKTTSDATIATEQLDSPVMEFGTITGDTVQQVIQCMKMALQSEKEDELFLFGRRGLHGPHQHTQKERSRQDELVGMKNYCIQKMGKRIFDMAHDYLYRERIVERNAAGELSILTGLRKICPDVTAGFVLDQLLFLEHADVQQETDSIKITQNTRLPASIDAIILQSIT
ncbi:hypothetical protein FGIG_05149 [Fasciola gigantica]|uniref:Uncharacterized protein n=1 Tax=Fasciola gigantica TaxID=46835 RepID=A0A504YKN9_FASGI|nr:hypothetical protein FGIG_05149 [Fasciola gigantica]